MLFVLCAASQFLVICYLLYQLALLYKMNKRQEDWIESLVNHIDKNVSTKEPELTTEEKLQRIV